MIDNARIKDLFLFFAYLLLVFTSGLKYETGVDWRAYSDLVDSISPINLINTQVGYESVFGGIDVGFNLLISLIKYFNGGLQTLFLLLSMVSTAFITLSFRRYLKYPLLGVLLYYGMIFFYLDMSGIRQATSLSIFFYSIRYISERKPFKYFLLMVLAFTFHWSTLFLFPLYWIARWRIKPWLAGMLIFIAFVIFIVGFTWIKGITPLIFQVLQNTNFVEKVIIYSTAEIFAADRGLSARLIIHIFFLVTTIIMGAQFKEQLSKSNPYFSIFYSLLVIQLLLLLFLFELPEISERIRLYFYLSNIIVLPSFLRLCKSGFTKLAGVVFLSCFSFFYGNVHLLQKPITIAYYPYQNYFIYELFGLQSTGERRLNEHTTNIESAIK